MIKQILHYLNKRFHSTTRHRNNIYSFGQWDQAGFGEPCLKKDLTPLLLPIQLTLPKAWSLLCCMQKLQLSTELSHLSLSGWRTLWHVHLLQQVPFCLLEPILQWPLTSANSHFLYQSAHKVGERCCWGKEQILQPFVSSLSHMGWRHSADGNPPALRRQWRQRCSCGRAQKAVLGHVTQCAFSQVAVDATYTSRYHPYRMWLHFIYHRYIFRLFFPLFGVFLPHIFSVSI